MEKEHPTYKLAHELKVANSDRRIDIYLEYDEGLKKYRTFTDELKYGDHLEVIFNKETNMYTIRDLDKLRKKWKMAHGEPTDPLEIFRDEYEMQSL